MVVVVDVNVNVDVEVLEEEAKYKRKYKNIFHLKKAKREIKKIINKDCFVVLSSCYVC